MDIHKIPQLPYIEKNYKNLMSYRNLLYAQEFSKSKIIHNTKKETRKAYKEITYSQRKEIIQNGQPYKSF